MRSTTLVHSVGAYSPNLMVGSPYDFVYTKDPAVIRAWQGTIVLSGGCDLSLLDWFSERPKSQRVVLQVIDMANTLHTLATMSHVGLAATFVSAINDNRRGDIVRCIYEVFRPDVFIVNNSVMHADFVAAGTPAMVVQLHPPGNAQLRLNMFDKTVGADAMPKTVALGGLPKYIRPEVSAYLRQLETEQQIRLLRPNIEGGCLDEPTLIPPEPQIVVACRSPRVAEVGGLSINYTPLERDWKPATKYLNSIFSGSHFIGTIEQSSWELSRDDELALMLESIDDLPEAMDMAIRYNPSERHLRAFRRRAAALSTTISAEHYCSALASVC